MSTTMYFLLLRDWGASRLGAYAFISSVIAVVIACTVFGEKLDWGEAIGMAVVLVAAGFALQATAGRMSVSAPCLVASIASSPGATP